MKDLIDIDTDLSLGEISRVIKDHIYKHDKVKVIEFNRPRKEQRQAGHPAHYDVGAIRLPFSHPDNQKHMMSVKYSASVLVSNNYEGGDFHFVDEDNNILETFGKSKHYKKALIYDVSHKHKVDTHSGERNVFLFFYKLQ